MLSLVSEAVEILAVMPLQIHMFLLAPCHNILGRGVSARATSTLCFFPPEHLMSSRHQQSLLHFYFCTTDRHTNL